MKKKVLVALTVSLLSFTLFGTSFAAKGVDSSPATNGARAWAG